jgi:hypothetical protein
VWFLQIQTGVNYCYLEVHWYSVVSSPCGRFTQHWQASRCHIQSESHSDQKIWSSVGDGKITARNNLFINSTLPFVRGTSGIAAG